MTCAVWRDGAWHASSPEPVGDVESLLTRLRCRAPGGDISFGIDCPLGVPRAYARRHGGSYPGFVQFLRSLDRRSDLFEVCASLDAVSGARPFYPRRGVRGMRRAEHAAALGFDDAAALSRVCDRATPTRPAGAPVFWTLGANQSGKAAIAAWRDLVLPAFGESPCRLHLWPFDGDLADWSKGRQARGSGHVLLAETYPAEALDQLGLRLTGPAPALRGSKRRQADRARLAEPLCRAMASLGIEHAPALWRAMLDGFGADSAGEDRFDSVLGLICVISVLDGHRSDGVPDDPWVRSWEGWVLGQCPPMA